MHVKRIVVQGLKSLREFEMDLDPNLNIVVGNNETGKTTVLEAMNMVLTGQMGGRAVQYDLNPYYFNVDMVDEYVGQARRKSFPPPPRILIEAYLDGDGQGLAKLKGTNNTKREDCPGLSLVVELNDDLAEEFHSYVTGKDRPTLLPVEYFKPTWRSFAGNTVVARSLPFRATIIDTSHIRPYAGPDRYLAAVIAECLNENQRITLAAAYRQLRQTFTELPGIRVINEHLESRKGDITKKKLSVSLDMSAKSSWDSAITAHLDNIPFSDVGKGEQCSVQTKLAIEAACTDGILLIEEPENHLSHSNMSQLVAEVAEKGKGRQILIATHSSFVLNKLGIEAVRLLSKNAPPMKLDGLSKDTADYFRKLPGYDTLRLLLARRTILVEGPSDELVVQRAYFDQYSRLPLQDGVDVIAVRSLAFSRFLELGALLGLSIAVVTDNDGDVGALKRKYSEYLGNKYLGIRIYYDDDEACKTLEPQLVKANSLTTLKEALSRDFEDKEAAVAYMTRNKTESALKVLQATTKLKYPDYIRCAIES